MRKTLLKVTLLVIAFLSAYMAGILVASLVLRTKPNPPTTRPMRLGSIVRLVIGGTFCSGTVLNDHTVLTAAHCALEDIGIGMLMARTDIEVRAADNVARGTKVAVLAADPRLDNAVLGGDFSIFEYKPFFTSPYDIIGHLYVGEVLTSCGYPMGGELYCSKQTYAGPKDFFLSLQGIGNLIPGMSGGPTMISDGTVIGVNVAVEHEYSLISPIYNMPLGKSSK